MFPIDYVLLITMMCMTIKNRFSIHCHWGCGGGFWGPAQTEASQRMKCDWIKLRPCRQRMKCDWIKLRPCRHRFKKSSVFTCPHGNIRVVLSKLSTLEPFFKGIVFRPWKCCYRVDARPKPTHHTHKNTSLSPPLHAKNKYWLCLFTFSSIFFLKIAQSE